MLVLRNLQVQLISDDTGEIFKSCSVSYTIGSTDDVQMGRSTMTSIVLSEGDLDKAESLIADIAAQIKANEGIE